MEKSDIILRVQEIFREVLDDENIVIQPSTSSDDVEGWDSLAHIQLIVAIEDTFKLKFSAKEMISWNNVGEMVECIHAKLK